MNVVVLSRGVKVIPGPGQELYADTREARTCGGRQDAYLHFGQACKPTGIYDFTLHLILITIKKAIVKPLGIVCLTPGVYFAGSGLIVCIRSRSCFFCDKTRHSFLTLKGLSHEMNLACVLGLWSCGSEL